MSRGTGGDRWTVHFHKPSERYSTPPGPIDQDVLRRVLRGRSERPLRPGTPFLLGPDGRPDALLNDYFVHGPGGRLRGTEFAAARHIGDFCAWVNTYCDSRGRPDGIPEDRTRQRIALSRFRRTLAWHICRRPRGLVAASIQYGHVLTTMTVGYAGNAASGFPDDYAFERFLARLDDLAVASQRLAAGEHVSGPSADVYRNRVMHAVTEFEGISLTSGKQARALLANPSLQVVQGKGMACVPDPARALCGMTSRAEDPTATPDPTNCQPHACPNVARTDRDIDVIRERVVRLTNLVADDLAPPLRVARERAELDRLQAIINEHERSRGESDR